MTGSTEMEFLEVRKEGRFAVIRLTRPDLKNRLSISVLEDLSDAVSSLNEDEICDTIVITGSGDSFAAGADIGQVASLGKDEALDFSRMGQRVLGLIRKSPKRTIAAVNGFCMGGALDLALSCDTRIASPTAVFAHPGAKLGIITGWGGTQLLPRLIGSKNAYQMFLTADRIAADRAFEIGLIDRISDDPLKSALKSSGEQK